MGHKAIWTTKVVSAVDRSDFIDVGAVKGIEGVHGNLDRVEVAVDAFNALNRANVNEVTSVYGTYNFCGPNGLVPHGYKDATSIMIEQGKVSGCPAAGPPTPNALFGGPRAMF